MARGGGVADTAKHSERGLKRLIKSRQQSAPENTVVVVAAAKAPSETKKHGATS